MFCVQCGAEIEDDVMECPYCKANLAQYNFETEQFGQDYEKEVENIEDEDKIFIRALFSEHPIRFCLCAPIWIFVIVSILNLSLHNWGFAIIKTVGYIMLGTASSWCIYGPFNYREVRRIVEKKEVKGLGIIPFIVSCIMAIFFLSYETEVSPVSDYGNNRNELTFEEYLENTSFVELEELARRPKDYEGEQIVVEGRFSVIENTLFVGLVETTTPMEIKYDGEAYDKDFNRIGKVITGDQGYVIGEFTGDDTIKAEKIIVNEGPITFKGELGEYEPQYYSDDIFAGRIVFEEEYGTIYVTVGGFDFDYDYGCFGTYECRVIDSQTLFVNIPGGDIKFLATWTDDYNMEISSAYTEDYDSVEGEMLYDAFNMKYTYSMEFNFGPTG